MVCNKKELMLLKMQMKTFKERIIKISMLTMTLTYMLSKLFTMIMTRNISSEG